MKIIASIIPNGATVDFLLRGLLLVGFVAFVTNILFFGFWFFDKSFKFKKKFELPQVNDFILLIFPMSPVIGYVIINLNYLDFFGLTYVIFITLIFSLIISFFIPILLSYVASFKILMISGLSISFTIFSIPEITQNPSSHLFSSQFVTQGLYLIISFAVLYSLYIFNKKIVYFVTIVFFLTGLGEDLFVNFIFKDSVANQSNNRLEIFLSNEQNNINIKKNIYILVYESYANQEMLNYYGYNNSKQIEFLVDNGFKIYDGIYSNAAQSLSSTSRILDIKGELSKNERVYTSGNAFGLDVFKVNGYKTFGLFPNPYFFGQYPITWDQYYPKNDITKIGSKTILKGIYEGEFRFDVFDNNYDYNEYLQIKNKFLKSKIEQPTLFYTHNKLPGHSGNSGKCLANENQKYFEGMEKANIEMKTDVKNLIKNNSDSIIVILSDHGPYLTKNCFNLITYSKKSINKHDIQDRYGVFLAIYWPKDINPQNFNIEISQDIFPTILGNITSNKKLFDQLKVERKFYDRFTTNLNGINVYNGIINGGKNNGEPLFENRSYKLEK